MDNASCPIVAGAPDVHEGGVHEGGRLLRAARHRVPRPGAARSPSRTCCAQQHVRDAGARASASPRTRATSPATQALEGARQRSTPTCRTRAARSSRRSRRENRVAILLIGRPYHSDPGLNHGIPEEFQVLGYPILSMRSIPKDRDVAATATSTSDLEAGRIKTPLEINDVWPENYSANCAQKVWAAKFAARHPNVVVLDLSSLQVRPRRADLRPHRLDHRDVGDAVRGAARHRRQQAGRLDQDPRQDLRPLAQAARGAARGHGAPQRRAEVPRSTRSGSSCCELKRAAAGGAQAAGSGARRDRSTRPSAKVAEYSKRRRGQPAQGEPDRAGQGRGPGAARNQEARRRPRNRGARLEPTQRRQSRGNHDDQPERPTSRNEASDPRRDRASTSTSTPS